jgi:hypothetical protein
MNTHPLLDRLTSSSTRALIAWAVGYALNHREEMTPDDVATLLQGNQAQRRAGELLARYGLDLHRSNRAQN